MEEQFNVLENLEYYKNNMTIIKEIDEEYENLKQNHKKMSEKEKKKKLEELTTKIKNEREKYFNQVNLFSRYDRTMYKNQWEKEIEKLNQLKDEIYPKKKFNFSSKFQKKKRRNQNCKK